MKTKVSSRLREPTIIERTWFNEALALYGSDFFSDPAYYPDEFDFLKGGVVAYPPLPERLSHGKARMIEKYGKPHRNLWVNRVDIFLISLEGKDWEKCFSINLAGIDRASHLRAQAMVGENLPEGATADGQTYWKLAYEITVDLILSHVAIAGFISPFRHHLATGNLEPCEPLAPQMFTLDKLQERGQKFTPRDREWMQAQSRLQEHDRVVGIHLDGFGFIH